MSLKNVSRHTLRRVLNSISRPLTGDELAGDALVFSPHPDDETLGCGGTIIQKKRLGADVRVVFMTDGSRSHRHCVSESELKAIRSSEAMAACSVLGVGEASVLFLEFKDGHLWDNKDEAVDKVHTILRNHACDQVFVPYSGDTTADHKATRSIVLEAMRGLDRKIVVYEYPIWFWRHWPWASFEKSGRRHLPGQWLRASIACMKLIMHLRWFVRIEEVRKQKHDALSQHRSQMTELLASTAWPVLADVSDGEFLACFFQSQEIFYRHTP